MDFKEIFRSLPSKEYTTKLAKSLKELSKEEKIREKGIIDTFLFFGIILALGISLWIGYENFILGLVLFIVLYHIFTLPARIRIWKMVKKLVGVHFYRLKYNIIWYLRYYRPYLKGKKDFSDLTMSMSKFWNISVGGG